MSIIKKIINKLVASYVEKLLGVLGGVDSYFPVFFFLQV